MRPDYNGEPPETVEKETLFEIIDDVDATVVEQTDTIEALEETVEERDIRLRREERRQFQQKHLALRRGK